MKKALISVFILSLILGLTACGKDKNEHLYWEYIPEYDWTNPELQIKKDVIPNMECAMDVAQVIYDNLFKTPEDELVIINAHYIDSHNMWVVSFGYPPEKAIMGGGISIALSKENGEVLSIWPGE